MLTHTYRHIHSHIYTQSYKYIHSYNYLHIYTLIQTLRHAHIHAHSYTYTQSIFETDILFPEKYNLKYQPQVRVSFKIYLFFLFSTQIGVFRD